MTLQYPALHAATHLPEGSDPLPLIGRNLWRSANPVAFDATSGDDISAAFHIEGDPAQISWLIDGANPDTAITLLGNASAYIIGNASALEAGHFAIPAAGTDTNPGSGPYMRFPQNIVGSGLIVQDSVAGATFPFWFIFNQTAYWMEMLLAGTGDYVDATHPFTWATGDWFSGFWVTNVTGWD